MKKHFLFILAVILATFSFGQTFTEVAQTVGINHVYAQSAIMGGGVVFFDYNKDGWEDIFVTGGNNPCRLYKNKGNGTFQDVTQASGLMLADSIYTMGAVAGDIDNDGDKDLFITTWGKFFFYTDIPNLLFKNNGNGTFTNISASAGITQKYWSSSATMGDYDLDGYLDIYVANYIDTPRVVLNQGTVTGYAHVPQPDLLYLNNYNNTFTEVAVNVGVADMGIGLGAAFTDFDNDHDVDIYVANDFAQWLKSSTMYRNNYPANNFTDIGGPGSINSKMFGMGVAIGDYDGDGDLDYYETNIGRNKLYRNNGNGAFADATTVTGTEDAWVSPNRAATGWGTMFGDFDNDKDVDLYVNNGYMESGDSANVPISANYNYNALFKNNGNNTFTNIAATAGVEGTGYLGRGSAMSDYDKDGDLDIFSVVEDYFPENYPANVPLKSQLFKNTITGTKWLEVKLVGTYCNKDGYGSHITAYIGNKAYLREIDGGSSHCSHNSTIAHFGLGTATKVDSLKIVWLGGHTQMLYNVVANQILTVTESPVSIEAEIQTVQDLRLFPNPSNEKANLSFLNIENDVFHVEIYNVFGQKVSQTVPSFCIEGKNHISIETAELTNGIYHIALCKGDRIVATQKLSVMR